MPPGVSTTGLYSWLMDNVGEEKAKAWWQWFTDTFPAWAREGWTRLDGARAVCRALQPPGS